MLGAEPLLPSLVFTDLDGSLLDQRSYDWKPAERWLERLDQAGVSVIPVTSKTQAEIVSLRQELGLGGSPFIAENGAVIGLPPAWQHARLDRDPRNLDGLRIKTPNVDSAFLRQRLQVLRERLGIAFRLLSEMAPEAIVTEARLDEASARLARERQGSEPLLWDDDAEALERFRSALVNDGLILTRGGGFWYVMGDTDKGRAARWLVARFAALRGMSPLTLGLGDGPNDVTLLEAVDRAVLIRNRHGHAVNVIHSALYRTRNTGPQGWAEGMEYWLGAG